MLQRYPLSCICSAGLCAGIKSVRYQLPNSGQTAARSEGLASAALNVCNTSKQSLTIIGRTRMRRTRIPKSQASILAPKVNYRGGVPPLKSANVPAWSTKTMANPARLAKTRDSSISDPSMNHIQPTGSTS